MIKCRAENETCLNTIRKLPNPDGRLGNFRFEKGKRSILLRNLEPLLQNEPQCFHACIAVIDFLFFRQFLVGY